MKKNTAALVFGILGAIFGLIGGILWAACAQTCAGVSMAVGGSGGTPIGYLIGFIGLGIGGALFLLIGGIQAFGYKKAGAALTILGFFLQVGCLALQCVSVGGFSFTLSLCTIVSVLMAFLQIVFAARKPQ